MVCSSNLSPLYFLHFRESPLPLKVFNLILCNILESLMELNNSSFTSFPSHQQAYHRYGWSNHPFRWLNQGIFYFFIVVNATFTSSSNISCIGPSTTSTSSMRLGFSSLSRVLKYFFNPSLTSLSPQCFYFHP